MDAMVTRPSPRRAGRLVLMCLGAAIPLSVMLSATPSEEASFQPRAILIRAERLDFTASADSNSPAIWERARGRQTLFVMNSWGGQPARSRGPSLDELGPARAVTLFDPEPGGIWMEAVVRDVDGTWYGYYHNEVEAPSCPGSGKMLPRIGAAKSLDRGRTWDDLGLILQAPRGTEQCNTRNKYFVGGVGDFTAMLSPEEQYLYLFYSQYPAAREWQGVAVARLPWADRDAPEGRIEVWQHGVWIPAGAVPIIDDDTGDVAGEDWRYPPGSPVHGVGASWHGSGTIDAFWGPSVHWNTYLEHYVMLLNRAKEADAWEQEGIYISFGKRLQEPQTWSAPTRLLNGGRWYPQVIGLTDGAGTDKLAGQTARFFQGGRSEYLIRFAR
jgi:hypothetical protein